MSDINSAHSAPIPSRKIRFHQRRSTEERRNWVRRHERSGQTLKQFCEQHGLALSSLCLWRRQLAESSSQRTGSGGGALVEIPLRAPPIAGSSVVIHLPDGTRVEVSANTDVVWLTELMRALCEMERKD